MILFQWYSGKCRIIGTENKDQCLPKASRRGKKLSIVLVAWLSASAQSCGTNSPKVFFCFFSVSMCACALSLSCVWCFFFYPMDCSPPGSSVHGIFWARILEWVSISYSRGSSWPRDWTCTSCISCIGGQIMYHWTIWEAQVSILYLN